MHPDLANTEYNIGAACPFDNMNSSLSGFNAFFVSYDISLKNNVDNISAADKQVVGCPDPAVVVVFSTSLLRIVAISFNDCVFTIFFLLF